MTKNIINYLVMIVLAIAANYPIYNDLQDSVKVAKATISNVNSIVSEFNNQLDSLENEQQKQKDYIVQIKKRMLELNDFINDIIDIVEDEQHDDAEVLAKTMKIYEQMKSKVNELIKDSELDQVDTKELMNQIIGES